MLKQFFDISTGFRFSKLQWGSVLSIPVAFLDFMYLKLTQIAFFANMVSAGMVSDNFVSVNLVLNMVSVNVVSTIMVSSHLLSAKAGKISPENPTFQA